MGNPSGDELPHEIRIEVTPEDLARYESVSLIGETLDERIARLFREGLRRMKPFVCCDPAHRTSTARW